MSLEQGDAGRERVNQPGRPAAWNNWQKVDVVGKLVSSILLTVIAILLKTSSDKISTSLEQAGLVQNLISDLTSREDRTRQDVALIALDHFIGDDDSSVVVRIAERLFLDLGDADSIGVDQELGSLGSMDFTILERRDSVLADGLRDRIELALADSTTRAQVRSTPDTSRLQAPLAPEARLVARTQPEVVYVQFRGSVQREAIEDFRQLLIAQDLNAPGVERVDAEFRSGVRFFHSEDRPLANRIVQEATAYFQSILHPLEFALQDLSSRSMNVPRGQIEVWINY